MTKLNQKIIKIQKLNKIKKLKNKIIKYNSLITREKSNTIFFFSIQAIMLRLTHIFSGKGTHTLSSRLDPPTPSMIEEEKLSIFIV